MLRKLKVISLYIFEIQEQLLSRNNSFFFGIKTRRFLKQKIERYVPNKTTLFLLIEDQF